MHGNYSKKHHKRKIIHSQHHIIKTYNNFTYSNSDLYLYAVFSDRILISVFQSPSETFDPNWSLLCLQGLTDCKIIAGRIPTDTITSQILVLNGQQ